MREKRQQEASDSYDGNERSIIKACPRFGKIKVTIDIWKKLGVKKVLVVYPRVDIQTGWVDDIKKWGWDGEVTFSTYRSLDKVVGVWDMVVYDEIHECSDNQLWKMKGIKCPHVLGLSGTMTIGTEKNIANIAQIYPCYEYSIEQGVKEGILCDYIITLHKTPLDDTIKTKKMGKSEKRRFESLTHVYNELKVQKKDTFFIYIKQIQLIQESYAKLQKTKDLLGQWSEERVLVFCGTTNIADQLGCQAYHSKRKEQAVFEDFCKGKGDNHLATIKMAQAGITIKPISRGLMNYISGSPEDTAQKVARFLGLEYSNPGKVADIHIVISDEKFEKEKVETALMFFDKNKIKWQN
jgi:superfamily II DNA or RNA helicase